MKSKARNICKIAEEITITSVMLEGEVRASNPESADDVSDNTRYLVDKINDLIDDICKEIYGERYKLSRRNRNGGAFSTVLRFSTAEGIVQFFQNIPEYCDYTEESMMDLIGRNIVTDLPNGYQVIRVSSNPKSSLGVF